MTLVIVVVMQCKAKPKVLDFFKDTPPYLWSLQGCPEGAPTDHNVTSRYMKSLQSLSSCKKCPSAVVAKAKALMSSYKVCI